MEEIFLDLHKVPLYGWEKQKSRERIDRFVHGLQEGEVFPPVFVWKIRNQGYNLDKRRADPLRKLIDGGHHRAIAHYLTQKVLRAIITEEVPFIPSYSYLIKELEVVEASGETVSVAELGKRYRS